MTGHLHIAVAPMLPVYVLQVLGAAAAILLAYGFLRNAKGTVWRAMVFALLLLVLAKPSIVKEQREPLKDTALLVIDDSASMKLGERQQQITKATEAITQKLAAFSDLDVETISVKGSSETDLFRALAPKMASIPHDRLAGIIAITDGEIHDKLESVLGAPFHALIAGHQNEIDRRIVITQAPAYGIVGKSVKLTLRIEDTPKNQGEMANVTFRRDDGSSDAVSMPVGKDISFSVPIDHAGQNLFVFSTDTLPNELTGINNTASISISGIRDRLRVLLISGQPHIGGRTWRNFLKADPAVDLIHFTILRSPMKMDSVPNNELALIAFPVHELFAEKLKSFDLVIFDRFRNQSLVSDEYLENIAKYVENGGALLISNATDDGLPPLSFSPLARILPAEPTGKILTGSFVPDLTEAGQHHPVTATLGDAMPRDKWSPWFRQIEARPHKGEVLMTGLNNQPLLVLDHVGQGRVAQFLSDQFWIWAREPTGGPQAELLRRVAHWLVQEPELDETALRAHGEASDEGWNLMITKQSLHDASATVSMTDPAGATSQVTLNKGPQPGVLTATLPVPSTGLYRLKDNDGEILAMVGFSDAPEFGNMIATEDILAPIVKASGGGSFWLENYANGPDIRRAVAGSSQSGRGWIGLRQNGQYRITDSKAYPLLPGWALIAVLLALIMGAWRREGRP